MHNDIITYNATQDGERRSICELLATEIQQSLEGVSGAENKVWHGSPVWFIEGNPIVGYAARKDNIQLLFWSGRSFDEPELQLEGTFQAAQMRYTDVSQINTDDLRRWLKKAQTIQWDYKNIVKRRGELVRLDIEK
jgi:hypothetical protein